MGEGDFMSGASDEEKYKEAKKRVEDLKGFYVHFSIYVIVNIMLLVINLITSPDSLWFYWTTIPWGIGLIIHALVVFVFEGRVMGKKWEDKKIRQYMDED
jgi:protein-S-isoprenylcysteine O-methyltransferase Ste14